MSRIRGHGTLPEVRLRRAAWGAGLRYRLTARTPIGRPDLVFPGPQVAVYVDGCFWHGCPAHYSRPGSSEGFWSAKLATNVARDRRQTLALEEVGWTVVRCWEHDVWQDVDVVVARISDACRGQSAAQTPDWRVVEVTVMDPVQRLELRQLEDLRDSSVTDTYLGPRVVSGGSRRLRSVDSILR